MGIFACLIAGKTWLRFREGKKVLELSPPVEWDKGKAALWLLRKTGNSKEAKGMCCQFILVMTVPMKMHFGALKNKGITVIVGPRARFSSAQYYLTGPQEVTGFLMHMVDGEFKTVPN